MARIRARTEQAKVEYGRALNLHIGSNSSFAFEARARYSGMLVKLFGGLTSVLCEAVREGFPRAHGQVVSGHSDQRRRADPSDQRKTEEQHNDEGRERSGDRALEECSDQLPDIVGY